MENKRSLLLEIQRNADYIKQVIPSKDLMKALCAIAYACNYGLNISELQNVTQCHYSNDAIEELCRTKFVKAQYLMYNGNQHKLVNYEVLLSVLYIMTKEHSDIRNRLEQKCKHKLCTEDIILVDKTINMDADIEDYIYEHSLAKSISMGPYVDCEEMRKAFNRSEPDTRRYLIKLRLDHARQTCSLTPDVLESIKALDPKFGKIPTKDFDTDEDSNELAISQFFATGTNNAAPKSYAYHAIEGVRHTIAGEYAEGVKSFMAAHKIHNKMTDAKFVFGDSTLDYYQCFCMAKCDDETSRQRLEQYEKKFVQYDTPLSGLMVYRITYQHKEINEALKYSDPSYHGDRVFYMMMRCKYLPENDEQFSVRVETPILRHEMQDFLNLDESERAELNKTFGGGSVIGTITVKRGWEESIDKLLAICSNNVTSEGAKAKLENRYIYYITNSDFAERDLNIAVKLQKRSKNGSWTSGRETKLDNFEHDSFNHDEMDAKVAKRILHESTYYYYGEAELTAYDCADLMVGTDRLFLYDHNTYTPIAVLEEKPFVEFRRKGKKFEISSNVKSDDFGQIEDNGFALHCGKDTLSVIKLNPVQKAAFETLLKQKTFPADAEQALKDLFEKIASKVEIHSDLVEGGSTLESLEGDPTLVIQILGKGPEFTLRAMTIPLHGGHKSFVAGEGDKVIYDENDTARYQVTRTLRKERSNAKIFEDFVSDELDIEMDELEDMMICEVGMQDLLEIVNLAREHTDAIAIEWPEGNPLKVRGELNASAIRMNIHTSGIGWFDVQGDVTLDESTIISIATVLEGLRNGVKGFVRLGNDEYVHLSDSLQKQLSRLEAIAESTRDGLRINTFQVGELADAIKGDMTVEADKEFKSLSKKMKESAEMEVSVPEGLHAELREYQMTGYEWITRRTAWGAGVCLADDMGLGKTLQTITFLLSKADEGASLVVAPASVVPNWRRELERFAPSLRTNVLNEATDRTKTIAEATDYDVVICTYGLLVTEEKALASRKWNVICLDEAHTIKNRTTKMSASAMKLNGERRIILTGTPIQNHLGELWNLFQFINPGLLGTYENFATKFIAPIEASSKSPRQAQLKRMVQPFMLRRTKSEVVDELPDKTEVVRSVMMTPEEKAAYEIYRQRAEDMVNGQDKVSVNMLSEITRLREAACSIGLVESKWKGAESKIAAFVALAENIVGGGNRMLVFSQFTKFLGMVGDALKAAGLDFCQLDGSTPIKQRERLVQEFQHGKHQIFLISLKAGGLGLNLTSANYVVLLDPWWNPAIEQQATDRAHRIGQERKVTVYRLITEGSIEEKILTLHKTKRDLADSLMDGTNMTHRLSIDELRDMLRESQK